VVPAGDWPRFRGPNGQGVSEETGLPLKWSATANIAWKYDLPGPGASSPVVSAGRVYVTCYSGYGLEPNAGDQKNLKRHLLCLDRADGRLLWSRDFEPRLPEHPYTGEGSYHGYAASTPLVDRGRLYLFFGKSGVYCFDLEGNELWRSLVGDGTHGWGSGSSPVVCDRLLIVNASVESRSLVALDRETGAEVWRSGDVNGSWNSPHLVRSGDRDEVVVSTEGRLRSFNPADGSPLWNADGIHRYVCPSVVASQGVVYAIGGGHTSLAVRAGGSGDVTGSHTVWRKALGSNVGSPVLHAGRLRWASDGGGIVYAQDPATGETTARARLDPQPGNIWSSPVLADGRLYLVSQFTGTFVVSAGGEFELLAHNMIDTDTSRTNASPAVSDGQIFLRTDKALYCIGAK
jgi:hypothetical protein